MEHPKLEEEKIIKDIKNLFRLNKEVNHTAVKDIRNLFRWEKETKGIKNRILGEILKIFLSMKNKIFHN